MNIILILPCSLNRWKGGRFRAWLRAYISRRKDLLAAVRPAYRSLGIATKLLASVLNNFKQMGAMSATLEVRVSNRRAQNLYSGMGFHMTGFFPNYYSDGEMALIMKKRL